MAETLDSLEQAIYPTQGATWIPKYSPEDIMGRIQGEAQRQGVDPALALAVAQHESSMGKNWVGDGGQALGPFQLHPGAAQDVGIDPRQRGDVDANIYGGIRYLKLKLDQSNGNVPQALRRYNGLGGGGDPAYISNVLRHYAPYGGQDQTVLAQVLQPTVSRSSMLSQIWQALQPGAAEAAPSPFGDLDALERSIYGAPMPPPATQRIARIKADIVKPPETGLPPETPGIARIKADIVKPPETGLPPETPGIARIKADIVKPAGVALPAVMTAAPYYDADLTTDVNSAALSGAGGQVPLGQAALDVGKQAAAMGITTGTTLLGALAGGAVGTPSGPGAILPASVGAAAGSLSGRRINQYLGLEEGTPGDFGDMVAVLAPLLPLVPASGKALLARTRGGKALLDAMEQHAAETAAYQGTIEQRVTPFAGESQELARQQAQMRQTQVARGVEQSNATTLARYQQRVADAERIAQDATAAAQQAYDAKNATAYQEALAKATQAQTVYRQAREHYAGAVQAQQQAVTHLQGVPERYLPQLPEELPPSATSGGPIPFDLTERAPVSLATGHPPLETSPYIAANGRWNMPLREIPPADLELQHFLRQQGGVKLAGEELGSDFAGLIQPRQGGRIPVAGFQNNASGLTPQQMAERAAEHGFITTADKQALLDALRESLQGRSVYSPARSWGQNLEGGVITAAGERAFPPRPPQALHATSATLYDRLADVAGDAPVAMGSAQSHMRSLLPEIEPLTALQPAAARLKAIFSTLEQLGPDATVKDVHSLLKDLGPLSSNANGKIRYAAMEAADALNDAVIRTGRDIPETAWAGQVMGQARQAWRQEKAVETLMQALAPGGQVLARDEAGRLVVNVKNAANLVDRLVKRDRFFAGSFAPEELQALRADIDTVLGTPRMPGQPPGLPAPITVRDVGAPPPPVAARPVPQPQFRTLRDLAPIAPGRGPLPEIPEPVATRDIPLQAPSMLRLLRDVVVGGGAGGLYSGNPLTGGMVGTGVAAGDYAAYLLSKALLSRQLRPLLMRAVTPQGQLDPAIFPALATVLRVPLMGDEGAARNQALTPRYLPR